MQADVAQLVEQSIRNRQVIGSSPIVGSIFQIPAVGSHCALNSLRRELHWSMTSRIESTTGRWKSIEVRISAVATDNHRAYHESLVKMEWL